MFERLMSGALAALLVLAAAGHAGAQSSQPSGPPTVAPPMLPPNVRPGRPGAPVEPPDAGLRCHQVFATVSADGETFPPASQPILKKASVPDGVLARDGERVYYVNGADGEHGIWVAKAGADGGWTPVGRVLLDGRYEGNAVDPDVVRLPDGRLRLFYFLGHFVSRPERPSPLHSFYSAVSDDGINFRTEGKVLEVEHATDPTAVRLQNGGWLLAVAQPRARRILVADSADGRAFRLTGVSLEGGIPELVVLKDGRVRLLHNDAGGIASYVSADEGRTWRAEKEVRLRVPGAADPSVVGLGDGRWRLFYKGFEPGCQAQRRAR